MNPRNLIGLLGFVLVVLTLSGCRTTVKGGEARHETGDVTVTVEPHKVTVHDSREAEATTQPSTETNTGQMPSVSGGTAGELGTLKYTEQAKKNTGFWWLGAFFLVAAGYFYFFKRYLPMALCLAFAILTFLYPMIMGVLAVLVLLYAFYSHRDDVQQMTTGAENYLKGLSLTDAKAAKEKMEQKHDKRLKGVISAVKSR